MSPLSVVTLNVAWAAALSSIGSAKVMMIGAATPTVVPLGIWNDARIVFSGLIVASVPVIGDSLAVGVHRGAVEGVGGVVGQPLAEGPGRLVLGDRAGDRRSRRRR